MGEITRGDGTTTKQMQEAPRGAIFVWCNGHLSYPRDLARHLGRDDIKIVSPDALDGYRLHGLRLPIILDHAAARVLNSRQWERYHEYTVRLKQSSPTP